MILLITSIQLSLITMTSDYITITTWNTKLQKVEYHYVPKSIKNPKQYVKSLHPEQVILVTE